MKIAVHDIKTQVNGWFVSGPCYIHIQAWMPDHRRRDIDNLGKGIFDSITHAGVWNDDCQVDDMRITRMGIDKENPRCEVWIDAL